MALSPRLIAITKQIDRFTDLVGLGVAWLNVPLVLAVSDEVIARYFFHTPTIWVFDVTYMLYGTIFMLGAAYALHKGRISAPISFSRGGRLEPEGSSIWWRTSAVLPITARVPDRERR